MIRKAIIVVLTLLMVGTIALWIRVAALWRTAHTGIGLKYTIQTDIDNERIAVGSTHHLFITIIVNEVVFGYNTTPSKPICDECVQWYRDTNPPGLRLEHSSLVRIGRNPSVIRAPLWSLVAFFATYPTIAFIRGPLRTWRRRRRGRCVSCGYDLTGNVSGVCPECGNEF